MINQTSHDGEAVRFDRMSGLDAEQLDALEQRVSELLEKPWDQLAACARRASHRQPQDMADSLRRLQTATEDLLVLVPSSYRPALLQGGFCITLTV